MEGTDSIVQLFELPPIAWILNSPPFSCACCLVFLACSEESSFGNCITRSNRGKQEELARMMEGRKGKKSHTRRTTGSGSMQRASTVEEEDMEKESKCFHALLPFGVKRLKLYYSEILISESLDKWIRCLIG